MLNSTTILPAYLCMLLFLGACNSNPQTEQPHSNESDDPPNIIYILADDMGYGDLSSYGQKVLSTPNIDRLATEGIKFTQHYAGATVCAPSRASLLTGKQPGRSSVRGNKPDGQLLSDDEVTLPEALKPQGYASAIIGKWGVGHPPPPDDPLRNGFDHAYGYINMWHAHNFYPEFLYRNGEKVTLPGNNTDRSHPYPANMPEGTGVAQEKGTYVLYEFEKDALDFIEEKKDQPFFLYLALNMPHANNEAGYYLKDGMEVPGYGQFEDKEWPNPEKGFARMIEMIDETVGKVMAKVAELGLDDNTLIVFASDNGPHEEGGHKADFFNSNGELRGTKRDLYEGGIRVPMIARWPGKIPGGTSSNHMCAFWDVLPTFCDIAGTETPEGIDGISFLPSLLGDNDEQKVHDYLYWEFYELGGRQAVREGDWKYVKLNVRDPESPLVKELYNLKSDLGETQNVMDQHPEIVEKLEGRMQEAHQPHPLIKLFSSESNAETKF
ncbi:MAG: arylsulfatase [Bacteroidota bacterium]